MDFNLFIIENALSTSSSFTSIVNSLDVEMICETLIPSHESF